MQIIGLERVIRKFTGIGNRLKDATPAMTVIAVKGAKNINKHFADESGPRSKWKKLKKSVPGQKILQKKGRLRGSIRSMGTKKEAITYTRVNYANYHNSDESRTKLPQRKFMWFSKKVRVEMSKIYIGYVVRG